MIQNETRPCVICGQPTNNLKFCSYRCQGDAKRGPANHQWKGGLDKDGYLLRRIGERDARTRRVHIQIVEDILGHPLPKGAVVHHVDGNKANPEHSNLLVCPSQAYHMAIHARQRVVDHGGDPNKEKFCYKCERLKALTDFNRCTSRFDGLQCICKLCCREYHKARNRHKPVS